MKPAITSEDILVLLKIAATPSQLGNLGLAEKDITESILRLQAARLLEDQGLLVRPSDFEEFLLFGLHYFFPVRPGPITKGIKTGARPGLFFSARLPSVVDIVWAHDSGKDEGHSIEPLSPHCGTAAQKDPKLKHLLMITETMRIVGREARPWAADELKRIF